ncbi:MAG TPA: transporter substrate-binding domain-containing protein [Holophagaceae bacterium]|nr:transporter substrate-binding domain-containing protein [Holophagaceae bacterium]
MSSQEPRMPGFRRFLRGLLIPCLLGFGALSAQEPARRHVVVGINRDFPPYEFLDAHGQPAGYDVDLIRAVAELEGLELEFRADSWENTLRAFKEGRVALLPGLLHSESRETFARFSAPHLVVHYALFVKEGDDRIRGPEDLKGKRVLVERDSQMHDHLQSLGLREGILPVASEPEAVRRLARGEGDAAAAPQLQGLVLVKQEKLPLHTVGGPLLSRELCFAVGRSDAELVSRLNTGLAILNQTGRYATIYRAWFGDLQEDQGLGRALARWTLAIFILLGLALGVAAIWNASLRRQVAQATLKLQAANEEILARESHLDRIIEALPLAVFGKDPRRGFAFTLWNARSEQMFGLRKADVLGKTDHDLFPKEESDAFRAADEATVREGRIIDIPEEPITSHALGEIILHTLKVPLTDERGETWMLLGISEDITARIRLEENLRQTQKLESLGVLAGGIAHDFNNLLTALLGNLLLAHDSLPGGHPAGTQLERAEQIALKAADLTRQMLAYAGKGVFLPRPVDLNQAAREMASLLEVSISKMVRLRFSFAQDLPPILADSAQLQQVLMNLVTNASEAIGDREGEIHLGTSLETLDEARVAALHPSAPIPAGTYVALRVSDTGAGMEADVRSRIFDPFFTTKFSGRGLGLSAMIGILRTHGAGIGLESAPGEGTTFRLYFPVSTAHLESASPDPAPGPALVAPTTVLLVEDEPAVRQATASLLRQAGYEVLEAADGVEGCARYRETKAAIGVVLMDQTMPRQDGRSAAKEILAFDPRARIVLTSGFSLEGPGTEAFAGILPKPYSRAALLAALRQAMAPT